LICQNGSLKEAKLVPIWRFPLIAAVQQIQQENDTQCSICYYDKLPNQPEGVRELE